MFTKHVPSHPMHDLNAFLIITQDLVLRAEFSMARAVFVIDNMQGDWVTDLIDMSQ